MSHIPFNRVSWTGNESTYLDRAVASGHLSGSGPFTQLAETMIENLLGKKNLLTTSCTHALEIASLLLKSESDDRDEVIVPAFTFVSTASAFALHGYKVRFADISESDLNINPTSIESILSDRTRAICTVNYAGRSCDYESIRRLIGDRQIALIEDNAHGFGGVIDGKRLGTFGDLATHSFHETKNVSCGEGGNIVFRDPKYFELAEILREKGTNRGRFLRGQVDKYTWVEIGSSWVVSDLLAAVLVGQLERLEDITKRRTKIYTAYKLGLKSWAENQEVLLPPDDSSAMHTSHMFFLRLKNLGCRTRLIEHLRMRDINAVFHYQALNASPVGQRLGGQVGACPVSEKYSDTLVRLPLYESLSEQDVERVIEGVISFAT